MNDFDAIFVQVAVEKKMLNPNQAQKAKELIESTKGAGSTGELLVKNGLLNSMQVKDILRLQMERIKSGSITPNAMPAEPARDDGPSMTLMVNAADLFGGATTPAQPNPAPSARPKAPPQEDPGSQTLALNFNDIMNAPPAGQGGPGGHAKPQPDPGSQTLALNAIDLFGAAAAAPAPVPAKPAQPPAKPAQPQSPPPQAAKPQPQMPPARQAQPPPPQAFNPSPMQTLALNAADLFGGNVSQAGAKLSSVRNESGQGVVQQQPVGGRPPAKSPPPNTPAIPPHVVAQQQTQQQAQPEHGGQTLELNAADLFGGMVVHADASAQPGRISPMRSQSSGTDRTASGSGPVPKVSPTSPAKPAAPGQPAQPAQPKADALNAFDIFGLPAEAAQQSAPPLKPAQPAANNRRGDDDPEAGNTLQLNAADLFGSASEASKPIQRQAAGGNPAAQTSLPVTGTGTNPAIEPPLPGREPKPGQIYGAVKIIKRLGEGNMAIVFMGENNETKQQIALKFLKPEVGANTTSVKRFVREAESAQKIKHPNVLETYRVSEYRGWHYMEMELMVGEDIRSLMKRGTVPLDKALKLCIAAASGLQAAHEQGVIHRDIKPENLMIMQNGSLKIADFGLARVQEAAGLTMPGQMLGTPAYMAPEQWEGKTPDARTDIYALGVTLYDMVTGRRPVEGSTAGQIIQTLFGKGPTPIEQVNPSLPKSVVELVNQMVKVNADDRPAAMADVRKRMESALNEAAGTADAEQIKKDSPLGATMLTDEAGQAQLQAELKSLQAKNSADPVKPGTHSGEDEATMKMAPGELQKVLAAAPSDDEKKSATSREDATMAMTPEDVQAIKRSLAETEVKKDAVTTKSDDGGLLRKLLIAAIVLVVLGILGVLAVVGYFMFVAA